jgi:hypothetical protein
MKTPSLPFCWANRAAIVCAGDRGLLGGVVRPVWQIAPSLKFAKVRGS